MIYKLLLLLKLLIDGKVCTYQIHICVAVPPKMSALDFISYLKGKSSLILFYRHPVSRNKCGERYFWQGLLCLNSEKCKSRNNYKIYSRTRRKR